MKQINMKQIKARRAFVRRWANKIRGIIDLGGECNICSCSDFVVLEFHHDAKKYDKKYAISAQKDMRWSKLNKEMSKCVLLCRNCHKKLHFKPGRANAKKVEFINEKILYKRCSRCALNDVSILEFHHVKNKTFNWGDLFARKIIVTPDEMTRELKDSILLCPNCHLKEHFYAEEFNELKDKIFHKVYNPKELGTIDHGQVMQNYSLGMSMYAIAKEMKLAKSSIRYVVNSHLT